MTTITKTKAAVYNADQNKWLLLPDLNVKRSHYPTLFAMENALYILGGSIKQVRRFVLK